MVLFIIFICTRPAKSFTKKSKKTAEEEKGEKKVPYRKPLPTVPGDDVYLTWCYSRPVYEAEVAVDMLKKFQVLDFTYPKQHVYADLTLDMTMGKKKPLEPFTDSVLLPFPYVKEINKVVVFTENTDEANLATENGAAFAGGTELIGQIHGDEIKADFYVAVPTITSKLGSLRNKLKKKFPASKKGSVDYDILKMLEFFKMTQEYEVKDENFIQIRIATLDMPNEQIVANVDAVIKEVCKYRPLSFGPFVTRLILRSSTSEGLDVKCERFLPQPEKVVKVEVVEEEEEEEEEEPEDEKTEDSK
uniref:Mitochondrial ribosomal protein L1 n=1 Tax=Sphenodon punctatus TaxID=8508 RepID=A0A8D0G3A6_SPHPU